MVRPRPAAAAGRLQQDAALWPWLPAASPRDLALREARVHLQRGLGAREHRALRREGLREHEDAPRHGPERLRRTGERSPQRVRLHAEATAAARARGTLLPALSTALIPRALGES